MPERAGVWTGGGECEPNAACGLDDAGAYFQKFFAQGRELGDDQRMSFGDIVTQIEHQPICGGVQDEPHLIGERRKTGSSIRRQLALVQFDQIFHLPTRAIERVVDMLGLSVRDVGDDEADIEPQLGCFDAGADAPLAFPGFGSVVCLRVASQDRCLFHRAAGADVIGLNFEGGGEKLVARQAEDVIETIVFAPVHHLAAATMAFAPDGDIGCWPVCADATDDPS